MSDLADLMKLTYRGVTFPVVKAAGVKLEPDVDKSKGRTGTKVGLGLTVAVEATTSAGLSTALATALAALNVSGGDAVLYGLGNVPVVNMLGARSRDGGPHIRVAAAPSPDGPLRYLIDLEAASDQLDDPDPDKPDKDKDKPKDSFSLQVHQRPDGLITLKRTGELNGVGTSDAFLEVLLPGWQAAYPLPKWVVEATYTNTASGKDLKLTYELTATENFGPLPGPPGQAVSGTYSLSRSRDDQFRLTTQHQYDLLTVLPAADLVNAIRPQPPAFVLTESVQIEQVTEQRVKATFTTLESGSGSAVMNWSQSITVQRADEVLEEKLYPGGDPVLVVKPRRVERLVQQGSATCAGKYLAPQPPISLALLEPPEVVFADVNEVEKRTSWRYVMYTAVNRTPATAPYRFKPQDAWRHQDYLFIDVPAVG